MQQLIRQIKSDEFANKSTEFEHLLEHAEVSNALEF